MTEEAHSEKPASPLEGELLDTSSAVSPTLTMEGLDVSDIPFTEMHREPRADGAALASAYSPDGPPVKKLDEAVARGLDTVTAQQEARMDDQERKALDSRRREHERQEAERARKAQQPGKISVFGIQLANVLHFREADNPGSAGPVGLIWNAFVDGMAEGLRAKNPFFAHPFKEPGAPAPGRSAVLSPESIASMPESSDRSPQRVIPRPVSEALKARMTRMAEDIEAIEPRPLVLPGRPPEALRLGHTPTDAERVEVAPPTPSLPSRGAGAVPLLEASPSHSVPAVEIPAKAERVRAGRRGAEQSR